MSKAAKSFIGKPVRRFVRKEDGNIATFSVLLFSLMVMCGGLAVDLMRYEHVRTSLQQTLDRCTLAAAALKQTLDRKSVCQDYATKAGLTIPAGSVTVTGGTVNDTFATVEVSSQIQMPTIFAGMLGIPSFDVPARSSATQAVTNVEIALVLDVSRSMILAPNENRLPSMKVAAKEFVTTVLANDTENRTSIALVPYNGQVNLGPLLASKYNITHRHSVGANAGNIAPNVDCVDLPASVWTTNTLSRTLAMPQTAYIDPGSSADVPNNTWRALTDASFAVPNNLWRWCPSQSANIIRLPTNQIATIPAVGTTPAKPGLHAYIDGLVGIGATSINAGMKWGMAMLDPANRSMFNDFTTAAGPMPTAFAGRPFDYTVAGDTTPDSMKIIVLMTDGSNYSEYRLNNDFRSGNSPIWRSANGVWSIRHTTGRPPVAGSDEYFAPSLCTATGTANVATTCDAWRSSQVGTAPYTNLTWPEVFQNNRLTYIAWQFYGRALGTDDTTRQAKYNAQIELMRTITDSSVMDTQLQQVCTMARDRKVIVYGIAFEAPDAGKTQIRACSTDPTHYYEASTLNVATAFKSIAARISQLRLTQ
jgi:Flp pilus assembly protein TadG